MSVAIRPSTEFAFDSPQPLFTLPPMNGTTVLTPLLSGFRYAVTAEGKRFLVLQNSESSGEKQDRPARSDELPQEGNPWEITRRIRNRAYFRQVIHWKYVARIGNVRSGARQGIGINPQYSQFRYSVASGGRFLLNIRAETAAPSIAPITNRQNAAKVK
jgi:hypothetical protein